MRTGMRTLGFALLGIAAAIAAVVAAGCTASDDEVSRSADASVPLAPGSRGPGTPLLDGFTVPDGARLVDGPLPPLEPPATRSDGSPIGSWAVTMVVTGDPRPVIAELRSQAQANGYVLQPSIDGADPTSPAASFCRRDGARYRCAAVGAVRDARTITAVDPLPQSELHGLSLAFDRRPAATGSSATTFLTFTFHDDGAMAWGTGEPSAGPGAPLGVSPPPVPGRWPDLPDVGDPLEPAGHPHLVVLPGSTVLMPVLVDDDGWSSTSLIRADGSAERVFDRYVEAARALTPPTPAGTELEHGAPEQTTVQETRLGRVTWTTLQGETRDRTVSYSIMLLERTGGPATIRIQSQWIPVSYGSSESGSADDSAPATTARPSTR